MKSRRLLTLLLALMTALSLLSGCGALRSIREDMIAREEADEDDDDDRAEHSDLIQSDLLGSGGKSADFGEVVSDGDAIYYWRYDTASYDGPAAFANYSVSADAQNALVKRQGSKEAVLLTAAGDGALAIADGRLYFQCIDPESRWKTVFCSVDLDGQDRADYGFGKLMGVSDDGAHVFAASDENAVLCLDTASQAVETLTSGDGYFVASHDDIAYYEIFNYDGDQPALEFYAVRPGAETVQICSATQPDHAAVPCVVEMRFAEVDGEPYVYFAYGPVEGSGIFYQGGRIARACPDGSGFEVLAGENEPVFSDFTVNRDGSIELIGAGERIGEGLYAGLTMWYCKDGTIYAIEPEYGESVQLLDKSGYADFSALNAGEIAEDQDYLKVAHAELHGDDAYIRLERSTPDADGSVGWRQGFALQDGVLLHVSLKSGAAETLYTYSD